jgi:hypothetical protein
VPAFVQNLTITQQKEFTACAFSPDGKYIATASKVWIIHLMEISLSQDALEVQFKSGTIKEN